MNNEGRGIGGGEVIGPAEPREIPTETQENLTRVAQEFGLELDVERVAQEVERLEIPFVGFDDEAKEQRTRELFWGVLIGGKVGAEVLNALVDRVQYESRSERAGKQAKYNIISKWVINTNTLTLYPDFFKRTADGRERYPTLHALAHDLAHGLIEAGLIDRDRAEALLQEAGVQVETDYVFRGYVLPLQEARDAQERKISEERLFHERVAERLALWLSNRSALDMLRARLDHISDERLEDLFGSPEQVREIREAVESQDQERISALGERLEPFARILGENQKFFELFNQAISSKTPQELVKTIKIAKEKRKGGAIIEKEDRREKPERRRRTFLDEITFILESLAESSAWFGYRR